jgi:V/A-type H+-transporting ATPase subunit E
VNKPTTELETPIAGPLAGGGSPRDVEPNTGSEDSSDRIEALCERVRQAALASGEESLKAKRKQAEALVAEARARAEVERRAKVAQVQEQLQKQVNQGLQNARLAARARIAKLRWSELDAVLDEAEREICLLRKNDTERYVAGLRRFLNDAAGQLDAVGLIVRANSEDIPLLRDQLHMPDRAIEFVADDVAAGIVVTTPDGNIAVDQSLARRRQRHDDVFRLAAAEILFPTKHESTGAEIQHE